MKKLSNSQLTQTGGAIFSFQNISIFVSGAALGGFAHKIYIKTQDKKNNVFFNTIKQKCSDASDFLNNDAIPVMKSSYNSAKDAIFGA